MIKDQMDLALSVDTATLKATIDAYNQTDEKINAYSVGFIPWEMVEESTLFQWSMYHFEKTGSAGEISPTSWPYDSGVSDTVDRGVPFCYVIGTGVNIPARYVYKDVALDDWLVRGTLEQDGYMAFSSAHNGYDIANFQGEKYLIHTLDLQNIVTNNRNVNFNSYISIVISVFNDDHSKAGIAVCTGAQYDPIADTISNINVTVMDTAHSNTFSYAFNSEKFKQIGKTGFSEDVTTGGYTYHIFAYIVGIHQYTVINDNYVSAFIAVGLPFRASATYGYIDINTNLSPYAVLTETPQPLISTNEGRYASIGLSRISWMDTINGDRWANVLSDSIPDDSFTFTDGQSQVSENGNMRILSSISLGYWFKSYTYMDVKISALICTPIIKQGTKYYCPEYDENYALTGNWVEYTDQNINPDINDFDPADIPEPGPEPGAEGDGDGDNIRPPSISGIGDLSGFVTMYALKPSQLSRLGEYLWSSFTSADFWNSISVVLDNTLSVDPSAILNYVVSVRAYPVDLSVFGSSELPEIFFGRGLVGVPVDSISARIYQIKDCVKLLPGGSLDVPTYYNDFRDMEPCCKAVLHVPFCGSCEINPSQIIGKHLQIYYSIDFCTGALMALCQVSGDGLPMEYAIARLYGQLGATVQLSASNELEALQCIAGASMGVASGLMGNVSGMLSGAIGVATSLANNRALPHTTGKSSGFSGFYEPRVPYIELLYDQYYIPENYAHTHGLACNVKKSISDLHGFTVCENVDTTGLTCEADERVMIKKILESGFFVD